MADFLSLIQKNYRNYKYLVLIEALFVYCFCKKA